MTMSDILQVLADENDLTLDDAKTKRKLLSWCNTIYRQVVTAEEYPWRLREYTVVTGAPMTGIADVTALIAINALAEHHPMLKGWNKMVVTKQHDRVLLKVL